MPTARSSSIDLRWRPSAIERSRGGVHRGRGLARPVDDVGMDRHDEVDRRPLRRQVHLTCVDLRVPRERRPADKPEPGQRRPRADVAGSVDRDVQPGEREDLSLVDSSLRLSRRSRKRAISFGPAVLGALSLNSTEGVSQGRGLNLRRWSSETSARNGALNFFHYDDRTSRYVVLVDAALAVGD